MLWVWVLVAAGSNMFWAEVLWVQFLCFSVCSSMCCFYLFWWLLLLLLCLMLICVTDVLVYGLSLCCSSVAVLLLQLLCCLLVCWLTLHTYAGGFSLLRLLNWSFTHIPGLAFSTLQACLWFGCVVFMCVCHGFPFVLRCAVSWVGLGECIVIWFANSLGQALRLRTCVWASPLQALRCFGCSVFMCIGDCFLNVLALCCAVCLCWAGGLGWAWWSGLARVVFQHMFLADPPAEFVLVCVFGVHVWLCSGVSFVMAWRGAMCLLCKWFGVLCWCPLGLTCLGLKLC